MIHSLYAKKYNRSRRKTDDSQIQKNLLWWKHSILTFGVDIKIECIKNCTIIAYTSKALCDKIANDCTFFPYLKLDVKREVFVSLVNLTILYQEASLKIPSQYAWIYLGPV